MGRRMRYSKIVLLLLVIWLLAACTQKDLVLVPEDFQPMVTAYDTMGYKRISGLETGEVYRCYAMGEETIGVIQSVEAYEEPMLIWVVLDDVMVKEVEVLYENETEDYGGYVTERWFLDRLLLPISKPLSIVRYRKEDMNEVIAITGATVTSKALVVAVNKSREIWEDYYE